MPGTNVTIEQNVKKRKRVFLSPDGKPVEGGAEEYFMGHNMGGAGGADRIPKQPKDKKKE